MTEKELLDELDKYTDYVRKLEIGIVLPKGEKRICYVNATKHPSDIIGDNIVMYQSIAVRLKHPYILLAYDTERYEEKRFAYVIDQRGIKANVWEYYVDDAIIRLAKFRDETYIPDSQVLRQVIHDEFIGGAKRYLKMQQAARVKLDEKIAQIEDYIKEHEAEVVE